MMTKASAQGFKLAEDKRTGCSGVLRSLIFLKIYFTFKCVCVHSTGIFRGQKEVSDHLEAEL